MTTKASITVLFDLGSDVARITHQHNNGYTYVVLYSASGEGDSSFIPAESFRFSLSKEQREEFIKALKGDDHVP
jgi:hypothetical protein